MVFNRLEEVAQLCQARHGSVGAWIEDKNSGTILLQQALRRGMPAQAIDSKLTAAVTKCIQKIVFSLIVLVAYPKALDLIHQVVLRSTFVGHNLLERMVGVLHFPPEKHNRTR